MFIGANGSGKSTILEAIGMLSAAMTDRVNNNVLQRKGIRLSASSLYKSKFKTMKREGLTVDLGIQWVDEAGAGGGIPGSRSGLNGKRHGKGWCKYRSDIKIVERKRTCGGDIGL